MKNLCSVIPLLLLIAGVVRCDDQYARADEALRRSLMENYNKLALPNAKTNINFTGLDVRTYRLIPEQRKMKMQGWLKYTWNDPRFTWKPEEHMNIQYLAMDPETIWRPDLSLYNAASGRDTVVSAEVQPLVYPDGRVLSVPSLDFKFRCVMDMTYWPHDVHNCSIKIGSWVHSAVVIDLVLDNFQVEIPPQYDIDTDQNNQTLDEFTITDWGVKRFSKHYDCCTEAYVSIVTYFILARNSPAYIWTVKIPVVCLCLLTLVLFMLPPTAGEKIAFGGICLLLNFLYMYYVTTAVSHSPAQTPLIVQLLGVQLVLVMICLFLSAYIVRLAKGPHAYGLPSVIKSSMANLANFLCLGSYVDPSLNKTDDMETGSGKAPAYSAKAENTALHDWLLVSAVVDRLALLAYLAICIISLIRFCGIL